MDTGLDLREDWRLLLKFLPSNYEALAHEYKMLETQYGNAKITTADQLWRVLFLHVGADLPLRDTAALLAITGGPQISPNRVHKKLRKAGPYAQAVLAQLCDDREKIDPERWGGYEMIAIDGSSVSRPGSKGTDARLHAAIRLSDFHAQQAVVTDASEGETLRRFFFTPGQLAIVDKRNLLTVMGPGRVRQDRGRAGKALRRLWRERGRTEMRRTWVQPHRGRARNETRDVGNDRGGAGSKVVGTLGVRETGYWLPKW